MDILVVGGGGREHAIIKQIAKSPQCGKIYCCPGNGGIAELAECVPIKSTDIDGIVAFAKEATIDYCIVAQDDPLVLGAVDRLGEAGIRAFGPDRSAARLEGSKHFSKEFMKKYGIPSAKYEAFTDADKADTYIEENSDYPIVIKADGLALGKGVVIAEDKQQALEAIDSMMRNHAFGKSGETIVIEEFLTGPEVTVLSFTDGETIIPMPSSMDHKRAHDGDKGLNTGGMGVICPNPFYTDDVADYCMKNIFIPTIESLKKEGIIFRGCLYFGLMLTPQGPKVIEYNCRFGDPEAQAVLALLQSDLLEIMQACTDGALAQTEISFLDSASCCVIIASGGYPVKYEKGFTIDLGGVRDTEDIIIHHAGTAKKDGSLVTAGGRVLGVTAVGDSLATAVQKAYSAAEKISFEGSYYRTDIGKRALEI